MWFSVYFGIILYVFYTFVSVLWQVNSKFNLSKCELRLHITTIFELQKYWQMQDISWVKECRKNRYRDEIRCSSCHKREKCMTSLRYIYGLDLFTKAIEWSKRLMFHLRIDIVDCKEQIDLCVLMWRQAT